MTSHPFFIDQALHGYSQGHRELASSIILDSESQSAMLDLSDLLVERGRCPVHGYLTAYPLKKAQRHVFARTWLAGENQRPGSVWTHSLILDYKTLGFLDDLSQLLSLFKYPEQGLHDQFAQQVQLGSDELLGTRSHTATKDPRALVALTTLYGQDAQNRIDLPAIPELDENLAVALWRQMWPSLRRDFAFLTGPTSKTVNFGAGCSLQFHINLYRSKLPAPKPEIDTGIELLERDLWQRGPTRLRDLLGRYVIEAPEARRFAPQMVSLLLSSNVRSPTSRVRAVKLLNELAPFQRLVRDTIVEELDKAENLEQLLTLVSEFKDEPVNASLTKIVAPLAMREVSEIAQLLAACQPSKEHQFGSLVFSTIVMQSDSAQLAAASALLQNQSQLVLERPDIADEAAFWPQGDADRAAIIRRAGLEMSLSRAQGLFNSPFGPNLSATILETAPPKSASEVLQLFRLSGADGASNLAQWLVAHRQILTLLSDEAISLDAANLERLCLAELEANGSPKNPSLWLNLIPHSNDVQHGAMGHATLVVGFLVSLASPANEGLPLAKLVFDRLYEAAEKHRLGFEMERHLANGINRSLHSSSTARMIVSAIIVKWHSGGVTPEALGISSLGRSLKHIIEELVSRFGRRACEDAFANPKTGASTQRLIATTYKPKSKKNSFFFWEW